MLQGTKASMSEQPLQNASVRQHLVENRLLRESGDMDLSLSRRTRRGSHLTTRHLPSASRRGRYKGTVKI